ncbi:MAG: hypothetical protein GWO24_12015, partial [Akkermansiaceae bacterium]|nr:hypothetical protein [Akkermansiaceae bacterium]
GVGFEKGEGYQHLIQTDVVAEMHDRRRSCLIRIPFTPDPEALDGANRAELRIRYDDGFVAYLNGTEIARRNLNGEPDGDSGASASRSDTAAVSLETIDISAHHGLLEGAGENVLAIHGLNLSSGSPDFLISADLRVLR